MSNDFDLPEGWITKPLAEAAQLVKDKVDPTTAPDANYVGLEHVAAHTMALLGHGRGADVKSAKTRFSAGDVLYGKLRPYLNKVTRPPFDGISSTDFLVFTESADLDPGYLAQYLNQLWVADKAHHLSAGVELPRVDWKSLGSLPIAFPRSKSTQRTIVARIERARGLSVRVNEHLARARRSIERFRQAVLAAACTGRLTADWREDNPPREPASNFVTAIDTSRRARLGRRYRPTLELTSDRDLPDGWVLTTVGALVDVATGATPLRKRTDYYNGTIPWVTSGAVNAGVITMAHQYITDLAIRETNAKVFPPGTLIVAMYGEGQTRGRVAELGIAAATNQAVAALLFDSETEHLRDYLRVFFLENYERIRMVSFGGVQPNLSLGVIRATALPLPPFEEQEEIVRRASRLLSLADTLASRIDAADRRVDRSSQAILAKAFRGELVAARSIE